MRTAAEELGAARAAAERAIPTMEANLMAPRSLLEKQFVESSSNADRRGSTKNRFSAIAADPPGVAGLVGGEGEEDQDGVAPRDQYEALFGKTGSEFEEDRNRPHLCGQWRRLHPENHEYEYRGSKVKLVNGRRASVRWGQDDQRQSRKNGFLCFPSGGSHRGFSALPLGEIESTTEESSASEWHYEDEEDGEFEEAEITGLDDIDVELEDREDGTTTTKNEVADCAFSTCIANPVLSDLRTTRTATAPEQREDPNLSESSLDEITGKHNSDKDNSVHRLDPGSVSAVVSQLLRGVVRGPSSSAASTAASTRGSSGPPTTPLAVALSQTGVQSGVALEIADSLENLFASEAERLRRELKTAREKWERRVAARERNRNREQPPATGETDRHAKGVEAAGARLAGAAGRKRGEGAGSPPV
eukprot:g6875.t1